LRFRKRSTFHFSIDLNLTDCKLATTSRVAHPEKLVISGGADDAKAYVLIKRRLANDASTLLSSAQFAVLSRLGKSLQDAVQESRETNLVSSVPVIYSELGIVSKGRRRSSIKAASDILEDKTKKASKNEDLKMSSHQSEKRDDNTTSRKKNVSISEIPITVTSSSETHLATRSYRRASQAAAELRLRLALAGGDSGGGESGKNISKGEGERRVVVESSVKTSTTGTPTSPALRIRSLQKQFRLIEETVRTSKNSSEKADAEAKKATIATELASLLSQ
jgi:hypothetical protein